MSLSWCTSPRSSWIVYFLLWYYLCSLRLMLKTNKVTPVPLLRRRRRRNQSRSHRLPPRQAKPFWKFVKICDCTPRRGKVSCSSSPISREQYKRKLPPSIESCWRVAFAWIPDRKPVSTEFEVQTILFWTIVSSVWHFVFNIFCRLRFVKFDIVLDI